MSRSPTHVVAAIIEQADKVLICQRHRDDRMPLKWEFPGGKIEPGEDERTCLKRELQEELAIEAEIGEWVADFRYFYEGYQSHVHLFFYRVKQYHGHIRNRVFEQILWVRKSELMRFDFLEADIAIVEQLQNGVL